MPTIKENPQPEPTWIEKLIILCGLGSFFIFLILLMKLAMLAHKMEQLRYEP